MIVVLAALLAASCTASAGAGGHPSSVPSYDPGNDRTDFSLIHASQSGTTPSSRIGVHQVTLPHDGTVRGYRLYVSATAAAAMDAGQAVPLLLSFHGALDNADNLAGYDHTEELADEEGLVVAHPWGLPSGKGGAAWHAGSCCLEPQHKGANDITFTSAVIDDISSKLLIDQDRVFAIGHSNGGMLAYRLACELSDRIAAAGSVGGGIEVESCTPGRPVSFLHVHGHNDVVVPYGGGKGDISNLLDDISFRSVDDSIAAIRAADQCSDDENSGRNGEVTVTTWPCADGTEVRLVAIARSGHNWPPGLNVDTPFGNDGGYNATKGFWKFFQTHPRK